MSELIFIASKIGWVLVQPISLSLTLLLSGLLLSFTRWRRTARASLVLALAILSLGALTSLGYVAIDPLENRFQRPATPPAAVAGIIVLGGGMDADINSVRGGYELNRSGDRFVEALRLARIYPEAKVIMTGGSGALSPGDDPEAHAAARFFADFGVAADRLVLEDAARNTAENAALTRQLVAPADGETFLLVTSAFHMPRSVGLFRRAGFDVVPWPADYLSTGRKPFQLKPERMAENLSVATMAVREWTGLVAYWLMGRIDSPLPGPGSEQGEAQAASSAP